MRLLLRRRDFACLRPRGLCGLLCPLSFFESPLPFSCCLPAGFRFNLSCVFGPIMEPESVWCFVYVTGIYHGRQKVGWFACPPGNLCDFRRRHSRQAAVLGAVCGPYPEHCKMADRLGDAYPQQAFKAQRFSVRQGPLFNFYPGHVVLHRRN